MNVESYSGAELKIIESEVELGERRIVGGNNLIETDKSSHNDWHKTKWKWYFREWGINT